MCLRNVDLSGLGPTCKEVKQEEETEKKGESTVSGNFSEWADLVLFLMSYFKPSSQSDDWGCEGASSVQLRWRRRRRIVL